MNSTNINTFSSLHARIDVPTDYAYIHTIIFNILLIIIVATFLYRLKTQTSKTEFKKYIISAMVFLAINIIIKLFLMMTDTSFDFIASPTTPNDFEITILLISFCISIAVKPNIIRLILSSLPICFAFMLCISGGVFIADSIIILIKTQLLLLPVYYYYKSTST